MSITFVGFTVKINVNKKNITENITGLNPSNIGIILISKVVAAVLGITSIGPRQSIIITSRPTPNFLPALCTTFWKVPALSTAFIDKSIIPTSAITNPKKLISQLLPEVTPINGGNIRFPAPKNIENNANPIIKISLFLFIVTPHTYFKKAT